MAKHLVWGRVECLNEIRPGKVCGAHRLSEHTWCGVCGATSPSRPVYCDERARKADRWHPRRGDSNVRDPLIVTDPANPSSAPQLVLIVKSAFQYR